MPNSETLLRFSGLARRQRVAAEGNVKKLDTFSGGGSGPCEDEFAHVPLRASSMLNRPAPTAASRTSPPAIDTFFRNMIIRI